MTVCLQLGADRLPSLESALYAAKRTATLFTRTFSSFFFFPFNLYPKDFHPKLKHANRPWQEQLLTTMLHLHFSLFPFWQHLHMKMVFTCFSFRVYWVTKDVFSQFVNGWCWEGRNWERGGDARAHTHAHREREGERENVFRLCYLMVWVLKG